MLSHAQILHECEKNFVLSISLYIRHRVIVLIIYIPNKNAVLFK